ncbi:MAG: hypothetical protein WCV80_01870 [Candidatus Paceibacterota bacterium]|jgi:hypothetical protein
MIKVSIHKTGLVFGGLFGILHAMWALLVLLGLAQVYLDWIFGLHFLNFQYSINSFSFGNAIMLIVVTSIVGYVAGCVFGWLWNVACKAPNQN